MGVGETGDFPTGRFVGDRRIAVTPKTKITSTVEILTLDSENLIKGTFQSQEICAFSCS